MKRNPIYSELALIGVLCLPFIYLAFIWNQLPASIPAHYGANGRPDRYDTKETIALILGVTSVLMYLIRFLPRFDPKGNLLGSNFIKIRLLTASFWAVFVSWFWYISLHGVAPGSLVTNVLIGANLLMAGIGNLLYTLKPSFFVGIRTPWTLTNDTVWRKTHHLAGWLYVTGGLVGALLAWLLPMSVKVPVSVALLSVYSLFPVGYSYWIYRKLEPTPHPQESNLN